MGTEKILNEFEKEHLGQEAKKDRKALLGFVFAAYAINDINIVPTKIDFLGITVDKLNREAIPYVLALIILYFLVAFLVHSLSDFISYRRAKRAWHLDKELQLRKETPADKAIRIEIENSYIENNKLSPAPIVLN